MQSSTQTTCPYCGVGCGVLVEATATGPLVKGDPAHPANFGRLCSKGSALGETLSWEGRLTAPRVHGRETGWDEALGVVAEGFSRIIREHGPDAVAFYVSGQLLTEDYYVANKLMKGFIGSANIDTNSRLCMSSAVAAHKRAFGEDIVPVSYEDLELADLVVLVGSNTAWCHPVLYQRLVAAKERRPDMKIVVIDPRRTPTCDIADLHLGIRSGGDVRLFNGLLAYLHQHTCIDAEFVDAHTRDLDRALVVALNTAGEVASVAKSCGMEPAAVQAFYELFAAAPKVITAFSQGVNQSSSGTDKANSIINCHLYTGRINKPGAGPFSITGQPNAMGGREVGGLANQLAAHMDLEVPEHRRIVQDFWQSPTIASRPGLKAVDLFEAIHAGKVKAVWIMATNPVVSLPNANRAKAALERCELVVVSDCVARTDTNVFAHVLLPASAWGEKGGTVTNSERRISRQRAFLDAPGMAQPDWWIISSVARRMGFSRGFNFESPREIFVEHAALSGEGNAGSRAFDIQGLAKLSVAEYDDLQPTQWPVPAMAGGGLRPFSDGHFSHADGRARFVATVPKAPINDVDEEYPFVLNTGRIRDQWHTMTRTGKAARLTGHLPEPFVEMHPQDALAAGVRTDELVRVATRWGSLVARLRLTSDLQRRMIFAPIHWSGVFASDARVGSLVNPVVDPVSGEPEFKHTPARVAPFVVAWYGFALSRQPLAVEDATWWTQARGEHFLRYELAGRRMFSPWSPWARRLLHAQSAETDWIDYADSGSGAYRAVHIVNDRIESCLFVSPRPDLPSRAWLAGLFAKEKLDQRERDALLLGRPSEPGLDPGPIVCSCHGVGRNTISVAITGGCKSVRDLGQKLKAGTNCGSCIPELKALLTASQ